MYNSPAVMLTLFSTCLFVLLVARGYWRTHTRAPRPSPGSGSQTDCSQIFFVQPYLQLGTNPGGSTKESLEVRWFAPSQSADVWTLAVIRSRSLLRWSAGSALNPLQNNVEFLEEPGAEPIHTTQFNCVIDGLEAGESFEYKILKNGVEVFAARARARKTGAEKYQFAVVGDMGEAKPEQMKVAHQINLLQPDFIAMPGDLAYKRGRVSEYREKYFPQMNADVSSPTTGAPLLRSILHFACPGNHDYGRPDLIDQPSLDEFPDLHGYFIFWSQPLNGPGEKLSSLISQKLIGEKFNQERFLQAAQGRYPLMANYAYDYGNSHWLVLDANSNVDWTNRELQEWVRQDLMSSRATWKFVMFHQPPFTTHRKHGREQRMRLLARIFEECGVAIVFNGHAHIYERSYPMKFAVRPKADGSLIGVDGSVDGTWTLDRVFDGRALTRQNGVTYIISGAGGAKLQGFNLPTSDDGWLECTTAHEGGIHSFTFVEVNGTTLFLRQISMDGVELDSFAITK